MTRIAVLSDVVASRIAAGEVVERPASALKELIENAIDAGARSIVVELQGGGRDAIVVTDDGEGMGPDDLLLCLERHATSKIRADEDIEYVATLGFRGEAIPSIASVSRFTISSRSAASDAATVAEVSGGKLVRVLEAPAPRGTRVEVVSLFFNAPARRKFLRSADTERQKSAEVVSRFAIAYPEIRFRLLADDRLVFDHAPAAAPIERCAQVFGRQFTSRLIPVDAAEPPLALAGLSSRIDETRSHTRDQHLYVNRRPVRDRLLAHAVQAAYAEALPRGRHPVLVLLLSVPPAMVDVNVHPAKSEVRFRQPGQIHAFLTRALGRALREEAVEPGFARATSRWSPASGPAGAPRDSGTSPPQDTRSALLDESALPPELRSAVRDGGVLPQDPSNAFRESGLPLEVAEPGEAPGESSAQRPLPGGSGIFYAPGRTRQLGALGRAIGNGGVGDATAEPWRFEPGAGAPLVGALDGAAGSPFPTGAAAGLSPSFTEEGAPYAGAARRLSPLGQFLDSYILAAEGDDLLLVDQHAAHERVLFERIRGRSDGSGQAPSQGLLEPLTVEVGHEPAAAWDALAPALRAAGFDVERFGERTLLLRGVPAGLDALDPERLLRDVLSDLAGDASPASPEERARRAAASAACHAAIKVHFPLTIAKMAWVLEALFRCQTPTTCPHGRPALLRVPLEAIERGFRRR